MDPLVPHITLLDPNALLELSPIYFLPKAKSAATNFLPLQVKLTDLGFFDKRALYITVDSPDLIDLQAKLVEILPGHIRAKHMVNRKFVPHVTIAQAKPNQKLEDRLIKNFNSKMMPFLPVEFSVKNLESFKWVRPRTYEVKGL